MLRRGVDRDDDRAVPIELSLALAVRLTQVPLGRVGELREVGLLAAYLASPAAAYVTGQTLAIDGGSTL